MAAPGHLKSQQRRVRGRWPCQGLCPETARSLGHRSQPRPFAGDGAEQSREDRGWRRKRHC